MLSYNAERRAYLGEDPADIVADEMQARATRAAVRSLWPDFSDAVLEAYADGGGEGITPDAADDLALELWGWSEQALDAI